MGESKEYMTLPEENGSINISEEVIAAIAVGAVRDVEGVSGMVTAVTHNATAYLPLSELVDIAAELERIRKEIEKAQNGLRGVEQKLSNEKFVSRAPEAVVNAEREKAAKYKELIAKLEESAKAAVVNIKSFFEP